MLLLLGSQGLSLNLFFPKVRAFLAKTVPNPSRLGDPDEYAQLVESIVLNRLEIQIFEYLTDIYRLEFKNLVLPTDIYPCTGC